jgi:hypothetical protein
MANANPLWGAPRIHGELAKAGVEVSERTGSRLLRRPRRPVTNLAHLSDESRRHAGLDRFLQRLDVTSRLLVFVVLSHHVGESFTSTVTEHPTATRTRSR